MTKQPTHATHLYPEGWTDYRLVDSGEGLKLEQFGPYRFIRPEPQALWAKFLPDSEWTRADGVFLPGGMQRIRANGRLSDKLPTSWQMVFEDIKFTALPTPFRHLGFSPNNPRTGNGQQKKLRTSSKKQAVRQNC